VIPHPFTSSNNTVYIETGVIVNDSVFGGRVLEAPTPRNNPGPGDFTALPTDAFNPGSTYTTLPLLASYNAVTSRGRASGVEGIRGGSIVLRNNLQNSRFKARGNTVAIIGNSTGTSTASHAHGGWVEGNADNFDSNTVNNHVIISGHSRVGESVASGGITGGTAAGYPARAAYNTVSIDGDVIGVLGPNVGVGDAGMGIRVFGDIGGGRAQTINFPNQIPGRGAPGIFIANANAKSLNNNVIISGEYNIVISGNIEGGLTRTASNNSSELEVTGNYVNISGIVEVDGHIYGGRTHAQGMTGAINSLPGGSTATATANEVIIDVINIGTVGSPVLVGPVVLGNVSGGRTHTHAITGSALLTENSSGIATGNEVTIRGGTVHGNILGGFASFNLALAVPSQNSSGIATGNEIIISRGTVYGDILGGFVSLSSTTDSGNFSGKATDNTITISGGLNTDLSASTLFGGLVGRLIANIPIAQDPGRIDAVSGNTLNVNSALITVNGVENFYYMNFILPTAVMSAPYNRVMLTSNNPANVFSVGDGSNTVGMSFYPAIPLNLPFAEDYGHDLADPNTLPTDIILILNVTDAADPFISRHVTVGQYKFCVFVANNVPALGAHSHNLVARLIEIIDLSGGGNNDNGYNNCDCDDDYGAASGPRDCTHGGGGGCSVKGSGVIMLAMALLALIVKKKR